MVDCCDGTWRAHINFFDIEVPCESKWSCWFESYNDYILHYAKLTEQTGCEKYIIGCELVQSERCEREWRRLIQNVRHVYKGLLTYNTDKYQEGHVKWWDALDVISSSGYYPIKEWDENLNRIQKVGEQYQKPFFFAECGCASRKGSANIPNDWTYEGDLDLNEQASYYSVMFDACQSKKWLNGSVCWEWFSFTTVDMKLDDSYSVYKKTACEVIRSYFSEN